MNKKIDYIKSIKLIFSVITTYWILLLPASFMSDYFVFNRPSIFFEHDVFYYGYCLGYLIICIALYFFLEYFNIKKAKRLGISLLIPILLAVLSFSKYNLIEVLLLVYISKFFILFYLYEKLYIKNLRLFNLLLMTTMTVGIILFLWMLSGLSGFSSM